MMVTANVVAACTLSTSPLDFGDYVQGSSNTQVIPSSDIKPRKNPVTVNCGSGVAWHLDADGGLNFVSGTRRMSGGGAVLEYLNYNLFTDTTLNQVWGTGAGGVDIDGTGAAADQMIDIFGQIPSGQTSSPGPYSDMVTLTLTFEPSGTTGTSGP